MSSGVAVHVSAIKSGADASVDHTSINSADPSAYGAPIAVGTCPMGSFQVNWNDLTGTINGTATLMCSVDGVRWPPKSDGDGNPVQIVLIGATGQNLISLNMVMSEPYYQVVYAHGGITGGTVECIVWAKSW